MANDVRITISGDAKEAERAIADVKKDLGELEKGVGGISEAFERNRQKIGIALTAAGAAITGFAALAVKSAFAEQQGIAKLDQALKRVGESYTQNQEAIEGVIKAQQKKTNFGDGPQRQALESLVTLTGNYQMSLSALPAVLDVATSLNMDLNSAALLVGKALAGNTTLMSRYGIQLEEGASQTEIIAALTKQFGGSAEAAATPMSQLKNTLGDLMETVGTALIPIITKAAQVIGAITQKIMGWMEEHPKLAKVITVVVVSLGALLAIFGPLLLMLPTLITGFTALGMAITIATGPIGLLVLAIAAVVAGVAALWVKWDEIWGWISEHKAIAATIAAVLSVLAPFVLIVVGLVALAKHWADVWNGIKVATEEIIDFLLNSPFKWLLALLGPVGIIVVAATELAKHWGNIWHGIKTTIVTVWTAIQQVVEKTISTLMAVISPFLTAWDKVSGIAGNIGGEIKGIFGKIPGFQKGGAFTVGGVGSPDSQLVAFRATPGEQVTVSRPGQTNSGEGVALTVNIVVKGDINGIDDFNRKVGGAIRDLFTRGGLPIGR